MGRWDHEADVVVVGSGGAGLAAAIGAGEAGARVVVLEAGEEPGGTTRGSGGAFWIPNNTLMRAAGVEDPRDDALRLMARLSYPSLYAPDAPLLGLTPLQHALLSAYYDEAAPVIDELMRLGAIRAMILPQLGASPGQISDPDYHAELPENRAPYGRVLTAITPPGAMAWPGQFLVEDLVQHVRGRGVAIHTGHRVTAARTNGRGEVIGVEGEHEGRTFRVRARRGVVFASGGFGHDGDRLLSLLRGPVFGSGSVPTGRGDFLDIGADLGAETGNLTNGFYYQAVLDELVANGGAVRNPFTHCFLPYGDSSLLVNKYGRRFVNEKAMYHVRAQSHFHFTGTEYPNLVQILIYDQAVADEPTFWPWRGCVPLPGMPAPWVITAPTLEALGAAISVRLEELRGRRAGSAAVDVQLAPDFVPALRATLERFNQHAVTGVDPDFHRGETPIQQAWQGPSRGAPNRTMHPLSLEGPFYAILLGAALLDTCGGPAIDARAQVLRRGGEPIPGLFGAGNCVASPAGQGYWGAGGTIGPALTFGFIAGRNAAAEAARSE
jgi:3-oxosteroid 1-dehydrogenase